MNSVKEWLRSSVSTDVVESCVSIGDMRFRVEKTCRINIGQDDKATVIPSRLSKSDCAKQLQIHWLGRRPRTTVPTSVLA